MFLDRRKAQAFVGSMLDRKDATVAVRDNRSGKFKNSAACDLDSKGERAERLRLTEGRSLARWKSAGRKKTAGRCSEHDGAAAVSGKKRACGGSRCPWRGG